MNTTSHEAAIRAACVAFRDACTSVPPLTLPVHHALTGQAIAELEAKPEDTILKLRQAAANEAGLDVNLRLLHEGRLLADKDTVGEVGLRDRDQVLAVAERRQREIQRVLEVYEKAERLNACFMVDCTGSMGSHIRAVKDQIHEIVREMQTRLPDMQLRLSFIGYRDHGDAVRFELLPFTTSVHEFGAFVANVRARGGGGDGPEDVHGAVDLATTLDWSAGGAATRVLIHIADHPAHGREWNDSPRDHFPDGDPYGLDLVGLMQKLQAVDVQYVFGHITDHTQKMVHALNEKLGGYIDTKDMKEVAQVAEAVASSLHSSVASTVSTLSAHNAPRTLGAEEMTVELPDWGTVPKRSLNLCQCLPVQNVRELSVDADPRATRRIKWRAADVQVAPMPFSQGESRLAFHALVDNEPSVAKYLKKSENPDASMDDEEAALEQEDIQESHLALSEVSAVACYLADLFSTTQPEGEKITFLDSGFIINDGVAPLNLEAALPVDDFKRYSNNIGWWESDAPLALMRFTRWTYEATGGHMMVVDLQGARVANGWLLTDPCILCADVSRLGTGNLGPYAITRCVTGLTRRLDVTSVPANVNTLPPGIVAPENAWAPSASAPVPDKVRAVGGSAVDPLDVDGMIASLLAARGYKRGCLVKIQEGQVRSLLEAAREVFLRQPSLLELDAPLKVLGDIHGQFYDLLEFFALGGDLPASNYLMLGDYVDRGKQSIETICLLLALKVKYRENLFLLRGNHECASITRIYGFYDECKRRYNVKLWKGFCDVFNCLPPAALVDDKILCMHGGISPELNTFEQIRSIARPTDVPDTGLLCDLLWADPDKDVSGWCENDRGVSYTYGADVLETFNQRHGLDLIVRAHQVVEDGYEFFGNRQLLTVFSAPNYCGEFDNAGALFDVREDLFCSFRTILPAKKKQINSTLKDQVVSAEDRVASAFSQVASATDRVTSALRSNPAENAMQICTGI